MDKTTSGTFELTCDSESCLTFIETRTTSKAAVVLTDESQACFWLREMDIIA